MSRFIRLDPALADKTNQPGLSRADTAILDCETNYCIAVNLSGVNKSQHEVFFIRYTPGLMPKEEAWITARDYSDYVRFLASRNITLRPGMQIADLGCGLSGFTLQIAQTGEFPRPIAVDNANYDAIDTLLAYGREHFRSRIVLERMQVLQSRADILRNPAKVDFYNISLSDFFSQQMPVARTIDLAVDFYGAGAYALAGAQLGKKADMKHVEDYLLAEEIVANTLHPQSQVALCNPADQF